MAQQQARDEAGNIWNIDESGNPVSLASPAPQQGGGSVVAPNPVQAQRQSVDLGGAQLGNQRTAQQIALDAAKVPYADRQAAADTATAETKSAYATLVLDKARKAAAVPDANKTKYDNLKRAIADMRQKYKAGPGATKGLAGLLDYLPTTGNQRFDSAGNSAAAFIGPALNLTAQQLNTPGETERAVGPYIPQSGNKDAVIEDKFARLEALANSMAVGRNPSQASQPMQGMQQPQGAMIPGAGTTPQAPSGPEGYSVGTTGGGVSGGSGGGSTFASAAGVAMSKKLSEAYTKGAGVQELNRLLSDNGFQTFSDPATIAAIAKRGRLNFAPPVADDTRGGVGKALGSLADSAGGAYAINAADALTAGTLDNIAGGQSKLAIDYSQQQYPVASLAGTVTGGALAAGGAELGLARAGLGAGAAALGGDALYGAAYGAGSADDGSRVLGALGGGVGGLAGGATGRGIARGVGGAFRGVQNSDAQGLRAAGVPLTVGQTLGGAAKGIEDRLSGVPVLGGIVNARRLEGMQGFNRAAFDEALAPIGANTGGITGPRGIDAAQNATRQGYDNALNGVSVTRDPQFTGDYNGAIAQGSQVPRVGPEFEAWARSDLDPLTAQPQYDGATIQDFIQQTRGADFGNDAMGNLVGRSVTGAEDAMRGLVDRQAPGVMPALRNADQAYRQTQVLKDAVNRARNGTRVGETGTFAPSQLNDAAAANGKRFGGSQGTTRQPFFNLTEAGQSVLPNSVPDSGTAGRLLTQQALGAAGLGVLGGGAGYAGGGEDGAQALGASGLATGALLAAGGSRAAQRALVASLIDRPQVAVRLGTGIANRARIGGLFGAPMLAGAGSQLATQ